MCIRNGLAFVVVVCVSVLSAAAAQVPEQQKLLARRAAEADAFRKLAEAVYGLQINSRTYVRDFVTESDEIRSVVDAFIRGIRLGTPTWYEDGSCEVPAEVSVAKVIETLRTAHERHYEDDDVRIADFESMARRIEKNVIKVIGMGAPRPDLPPDLPEGVAEQLGAPPAGPAEPPIPDIWKKVGAQARLMAIRAAELDAKRRLAERIKGLRLTSRTLVRDFVPQSDEIRTEMDAMLVGAEPVGPPYLHHDELIVEVRLRVPTEQVITNIKRWHSRHYKGDDVKGSDIESIVRTVVKRDFEETGMGVPPPQFIRRYEQRAEVRLPEWAEQSLEAEGLGTDPEFSTPQGRLRAARAAELDARRNLAERIAGLHIESETTVQDFIARHDHVATQVDAMISDATLTSTRFSNETAIVTVSVPGLRVWSQIHQELIREKRRR